MLKRHEKKGWRQASHPDSKTVAFKLTLTRETLVTRHIDSITNHRRHQGHDQSRCKKEETINCHLCWLSVIVGESDYCIPSWRSNPSAHLHQWMRQKRLQRCKFLSVKMSVGGDTSAPWRHLLERHCHGPLSRWMFYSSADDTGRRGPVWSQPISISIAALWWSSRGEKGWSMPLHTLIYSPTTTPVFSFHLQPLQPPPNLYLSIKGMEDDKTRDKKKSTIPHHTTGIDPGMCRRETRLHVYMCTHRFDRDVAVRRATILSNVGGGECLLLQHLPPRRHKYSGGSTRRLRMTS